MYIAKEKEKKYKKEKSSYSDQFLEITVQTPPGQHQKSSFFKATPPRREQSTSIIVVRS
jgi:hypothetical protein